MKGLFAILSVLVLMIVSTSSLAQQGWALELKPDVDFTSKSFGDGEMYTDRGYELLMFHKVVPRISGYLGWGAHHYSVGKSFMGNNMKIEETGYMGGLMYTYKIIDWPVDYFVRVAATYDSFVILNVEDKSVEDTNEKLGWQMELGFSVPIVRRIELRPHLRYRAVTRDIEIDEQVTSVNLNNIHYGIGIYCNLNR